MIRDKDVIDALREVWAETLRGPCGICDTRVWCGCGQAVQTIADRLDLGHLLP